MFIKVTAANGSELWVNADHIESFGRITKDNYDCEDDLLGLTFLCMGDEGGNYVVRETPERLMELMGEPAMMETNLEENAATICDVLNADADGESLDMVEVVRCKDCRYYHNGDCSQCCCFVGDDDYCSKGAKEEVMW